MSSCYPLEKIRAHFPALSETHNGFPVAYFDGPGGSQVLSSVIEAQAEFIRTGTANLGRVFPTAVKAEQALASAREAMADFIGVQSCEIAFGANMTSLAYQLAFALARDWTPEHEVVVTEMDHLANVDPWRQLAEEKQTRLRWIPLDKRRLVLQTEQLETLINQRTKLVAIVKYSSCHSKLHHATHRRHRRSPLRRCARRPPRSGAPR